MQSDADESESQATVLWTRALPVQPFSTSWNLVLMPGCYWCQCSVCKPARNRFGFPRPELVREPRRFVCFSTFPETLAATLSQQQWRPTCVDNSCSWQGEAALASKHHWSFMAPSCRFFTSMLSVFKKIAVCSVLLASSGTAFPGPELVPCL